MKTQTLVELLARGAGPAPRHVAARRLLPAAGFGVLASAALALALIGPIPAALYATAAPWVKLGYAAVLAAAALWLTATLSRPVARPLRPGRAVAAVVAAMGLIGLVALLATPAGERMTALLGHSALACPGNVLALSLPALAAALWALRGLAPTRPHAAGAAAGLLAGALGAAGYALACTETSPGFVAAWYSLGIGLTAALGAIVGPRVLRW
ncbi:MAG: DUF1109 domain-containing protein [Rubrivivax sp.]|nr:DUF1109 domain-containing protein [Rubrivivax sp.]